MTNAPSDLFELRVRPRRTVRWVLGAASILLVLLAWWLVTLGGEPHERLVPPLALPSPAEVVASVPSLVGERPLFASIAATLQRVLLGFGLAIAIGVPLGVLAGSWRGIDAFMAPISLFGRNTPIAALIPLTLAWFGIGELQKVMFIFIATAPFVFGSTVQAVIDVPDRYVETARTLGASRWQTVRKVLMPSALPSIYDSLRILFGLAFGYIMLAEVIDAKRGLGHLINGSRRQAPYEHIFLILVLIALIAFAIDRVLFFFQRGLFPHRKDLAKG